MPRRKKVEYVLTWKWMQDVHEEKTWNIEYGDALDAEGAINAFHKRMKEEYGDYSKTLVVIKDVWQNN